MPTKLCEPHHSITCKHGRRSRIGPAAVERNKGGRNDEFDILNTSAGLWEHGSSGAGPTKSTNGAAAACGASPAMDAAVIPSG